jgi:multiple sugar transport system substrate-binding protein
MTKARNRGGPSRRELLAGGIAAAGMLGLAPGFVMTPRRAAAAGLDDVHVTAAQKAKELAGGRAVTLTIMQPSGSLGNVKPVADRFTEEAGIAFNYLEVPLGEINQKVLLEAVSRSGSFDIALPATFGIPDLAESGILVNLDNFAAQYEPEGFQKEALFSTGDYYKGSLFGYQTDGDAYLMFYLKDWLENADENSAFADKHGYELKVPDTWAELDAMMAHFHRPDEGKYGGALFRTQYFIAWEWWVRFHAKGFFPFTDDMEPQINNEGGVEALAELVAASQYLYPGARSNGLFENFEAYGEGDKFCNIGWGGTQKFLNSEKSKVRGRLAFGPTPGGEIDGALVKTPYFNWGWNYVVSSASPEQEIAYLYTLYACSPAMSTVAVRDPGGYFDPFRAEHYADPDIIKAYSEEFLVAHEDSMRNAIPDLYLKGQGEYFDELRVNIAAADVGEKAPQQALDDTAAAWNRITRRMNQRSQAVQWAFLKSIYPESVRKVLR